VPRSRTFLAAALTAVALVVAAGCGGGDDGGGETQTGVDSSGGAKVFADAGCGNCHTLAAAGANGTTAPNLDELQPSAESVERQVRSGGGGMPSFEDQLSDEEIRQVAEFVASSAGGGSSAGSGGPQKFTFEPDDKKIEDCQGNSECLQQAFGNLAYEDGPAEALERLDQMQTADPAVRAACHPIAHKIGAGGLLHFDGKVGKAFVAGNATCASGYYHGLLQWKLAGAEEDEATDVAREACTDAEIKENSYNYYQCNHGLGHGVMLYTGYELPIALRMCHGLSTEFEQVSCSGGVFMENLSSSFGITSRYVREDNLLYPCNIVSHQDKLYCYLLVTSRILPKVGWDWKKAADWCRKSEQEFVNICFQSYGRDASGTAVQDPVQANKFCSQAGSGEKECIFGAARDIMNNNSQDPRGKRFCEVVKAKFRAHCFWGLGTIIGTQYADQESRRSACARFQLRTRDLQQCIDGANSAV
jgi:mono/diheme cytochrome c family protein